MEPELGGRNRLPNICLPPLTTADPRQPKQAHKTSRFLQGNSQKQQAKYSSDANGVSYDTTRCQKQAPPPRLSGHAQEPSGQKTAVVVSPAPFWLRFSLMDRSKADQSLAGRFSSPLFSLTSEPT